MLEKRSFISWKVAHKWRLNFRRAGGLCCVTILNKWNFEFLNKSFWVQEKKSCYTPDRRHLWTTPKQIAETSKMIVKLILRFFVFKFQQWLSKEFDNDFSPICFKQILKKNLITKLNRHNFLKLITKQNMHSFWKIFSQKKTSASWKFFIWSLF